METIRAYLERKHEELRLLDACLRSPLHFAGPRSVDEVIKSKFQITAALRAEHALHDWKATETAWSHSRCPVSGPFAFRYDYQRADLEVRGPSFYAPEDVGACETIYTSSGMAAISALLLASAHAIGKADLLVLPGSYGETLELVRSYARHLRLIAVENPLDRALAASTSARILLLDSCIDATAFEAILRCASPALDLLVFDTTCFASRSGRIRRVLRWARRRDIPVVMVRSHTKLDSLGAEYGRLGSAVFVRWDENAPRAGRARCERLPAETRNAIRLLGGAALPAHFPPYVGTAAYHMLTKKRVAAILRNGRRTARYFASELAAWPAELNFTHGLYVTLGATRFLDEAAARRAAEDMSDDLSRKGFPIRHAGSFGFDFAATEWFHNSASDQYSVRVAIPDLPTALWDDLSTAIARWWATHQLELVEG
ncbi:hypothetical protein QA641_23835 [Bradyrhizobium sp. CB1650]|uniref:hypothetical protein n=1 Tax=Bradyrhizobium sp. CB1650 TaxID=3039153 RepID=UPI00243550B5|nr:hypothetical protein [Bradyrhizobium sp. CB1650]WGD48682.1 hypothetical protein QA641_23835 [Bradyrhizobium sp. CB1650]